jgi:hypothetical protein
VEGKTLLELWTGTYATLGHLRVFGTESYVHIPNQKRHKWNQKSKLGRLVCYMGEKDGYRIWIPNERKVVLSRDVLFKPEVVCSLRNVTKAESMCPILHIAPNQEIQVFQNHQSNDGNTSTSGGSQDSNSQRNVQERKSVREKKQPNWMTSGKFACLAGNSQEDYCFNPISYTEAMQSNKQKQWMKAMNDELASLKENGTWELFKRPIYAKVIQNRWDMLVKMSCDGNACFKARLVAKGYAQKPGIDYDETFSPVAQHDTIRTLLAVAASKGMKLKLFDVKTAFLYGELEEEVYLEQPEGFDNGSGLVCRLNLNQAPRCWNKRFIISMEKAGMKNSTADPCLFYRRMEIHLSILQFMLMMDLLLVTRMKKLKCS